MNLFNVDCVGSELELLDCSHSARTASCYDNTIAVTCNTTCAHGDVKLVDGRNTSVGRVEVCVNGFWRTVCDSSISTADAQVICRQLGYVTNLGK